MNKIVRINITKMTNININAYVNRIEYQIVSKPSSIARREITKMFNEKYKEDHPEVERTFTDEDISYLINEKILKLYIKGTVMEEYGRIKMITQITELDYKVEEDDSQRIMTVGEYENGSISYNKYTFNGFEFFVQSDGYCLLTAPTGNGKTFNATRNMLTVGDKYERIIYVNFELTKDDILIKLLEHTSSDFKRILDIEKKLFVIRDEFKSYFMKAQKFIELINLYPNSFIVIDNIDNLKDGSDNEYLKQSAFIQQLDAYLKSNRGKTSTALILTQLTKDKESLYKEMKVDGEKTMVLNPELNEGIVSGAKQLTNNARSVVLVLQHSYTGAWTHRVLKYGSGVIPSRWGEKKAAIDKLEEYKKWAKSKLK